MCSSAYNIYDNFSFELPLPSSPLIDKLEFCIQYKGENFEYWDSNGGKNYVLVCFKPKMGMLPKPGKPKDVYNVDLDSWGEFACWNHLTINESPYY